MISNKKSSTLFKAQENNAGTEKIYVDIELFYSPFSNSQSVSLLLTTRSSANMDSGAIPNIRCVLWVLLSIPLNMLRNQDAKGTRKDKQGFREKHEGI